jgi:transposase
MTSEPTPKAPTNAERRMEVILQDLMGHVTATQAAAALSVSRKVYYEWRERALKGLRDSLEDRTPGRPKKEGDSPAEAALQKRVTHLEAELKVQKMALLVHKELAPLARTEATATPGESRTQVKKKRRDES